jgi:hypothetical protein
VTATFADFLDVLLAIVLTPTDNPYIQRNLRKHHINRLRIPVEQTSGNGNLMRGRAAQAEACALRKTKD